MNAIQLSDKCARVAKIEDNGGLTGVRLEWSGPDDHVMSDFDLSRLGKVNAGVGGGFGGNLRGGWIILDGPCLLTEGETIPLMPTE